MTPAELSALLSKLDSTTWAAVVAAAAALLSLLFSIRASRNSERRSALRQSLQESLNETGALLYRIVAMCQKMTEMKTDKTFQATRNAADATCIKLDELSRKLRYALWGIDDGFRTMRMIPSYIGNLKNDRNGPRAAQVIKLSTGLREAIDNSVRMAYLKGKPPGLLQRCIVRKRYQKLRSFFNGCRP